MQILKSCYFQKVEFLAQSISHRNHAVNQLHYTTKFDTTKFDSVIHFALELNVYIHSLCPKTNDHKHFLQSYTISAAHQNVSPRT